MKNAPPRDLIIKRDVTTLASSLHDRPSSVIQIVSLKNHPILSNRYRHRVASIQSGFLLQRPYLSPTAGNLIVGANAPKANPVKRIEAIPKFIPAIFILHKGAPTAGTSRSNNKEDSLTN